MRLYQGDDLAELANVSLLKKISDRGYFLCHTIGCMIANSQVSPKQDQVISVWFLIVHHRSCQRCYLEKNVELIHVKTIIKKRGKRKKKRRRKRHQIKRFAFVSFFSSFVCLLCFEFGGCCLLSLVEVVSVLSLVRLCQFGVWRKLCQF